MEDFGYTMNLEHNPLFDGKKKRPLSGDVEEFVDGDRYRRIWDTINGRVITTSWLTSKVTLDAINPHRLDEFIYMRDKEFTRQHAEAMEKAREMQPL